MRTRVVLEVISSVDDGNAVFMVASGREEDLRRRKTVWRPDPCYAGPSVVGADELGWTTVQQKRDKPHKVFFDNYL